MKIPLNFVNAFSARQSKLKVLHLKGGILIKASNANKISDYTRKASILGFVIKYLVIITIWFIVC